MFDHERAPSAQPAQPVPAGTSPGRASTSRSLPLEGPRGQRRCRRRPRPTSTSEVAPGERAVEQRVAQPLAERAGRQQPRATGRTAPVRRQRDDDRAAGEQQQVDQVRGGERGLGPQRAGDSRPSEAKAAVPSSDAGQRPRARPATGRAATSRAARPTPPITHELEHLDDQQRADLAGQQPGPRAAGGAEPLEHAVAALEAGGDRQRGEATSTSPPARARRASARRSGCAETAGRRRSPARRPADQQQQRDRPRRAAAARRCAAAAGSPSGPAPSTIAAQRRGARAPGRRCSAAHAAQLPSGELEEDVLEGALAERERLGHARPAPRTTRSPSPACCGVDGAGDRVGSAGDRRDVGARPSSGLQRAGVAVGTGR